MKKNLLSLQLKNCITHLIIWCRYVRFVFIKKAIIKSDFLKIQNDFTFSNTLIYIDFHFDNLIFLSISGIDRKLYNGSIILNAKNLTYPISIKAITGNGVFSFLIEENTLPSHLLNSNLYGVSEVKNNWVKSVFSNPLKINAINSKFSDSSLLKKQNHSVKQNLPKFKTEKLNITINKTQFKLNENL